MIARAILVHNRGGTDHPADGIVTTPSHNPRNGGPAHSDVTKWIEERANEYLLGDNAGVRRLPFETATRAATTCEDDFIRLCVDDLRNMFDREVIRAAGLKLVVDPPGGASVNY